MARSYLSFDKISQKYFNPPVIRGEKFPYM